MTVTPDTTTARRAAPFQGPSLADVRLIALPAATDGVVTASSAGERTPFRVDSCVVVKAPTAGAHRGPVAHRAISEFVVCVNGAVRVTVDDGRAQQSYELTDASHGLLLPPDIWTDLTFTTADATLLVFRDRSMTDADLITDRESYLRTVAWKRSILERRPIRLNLGCGGRPLADYINIDMDSLDQIRARYPNYEYSDDLIVVDYDLFNLPFADNSVEEIRCEGLIEHLPFIEEPKFFHEVVRVLQPGGTAYLATVDFEQAAREWLDAADDWKDFFRDDEEAIRTEHWFGTYKYMSGNRWGYMAATFYGSQKGAGQFHANSYSEGKFRAICARLGLDVVAIDRFRWKGDRDPIIALTARKPV